MIIGQLLPLLFVQGQDILPPLPPISDMVNHFVCQEEAQPPHFPLFKSERHIRFSHLKRVEGNSTVNYLNEKGPVIVSITEDLYTSLFSRIGVADNIGQYLIGGQFDLVAFPFVKPSLTGIINYEVLKVMQVFQIRRKPDLIMFRS